MITKNIENNALEKLEGTLKKYRSGQIDPVTKIYWNMHSEINLKLAIDNTREDGKILDVGCGVGNYIIALSKINRVCFGIDPLYEVSLLKAQQKNEDECVNNISLVRAVSENLPFGGKI